MKSGINHVLPKPFKIAQLENLLGRKAAEAKQSVNNTKVILEQRIRLA